MKLLHKKILQGILEHQKTYFIQRDLTAPWEIKEAGERKKMHFSHSTVLETQSLGSPVTQIRGGTQEHSSTLSFGETTFFFHRNLGPEAENHVAVHQQPD